MAFADWKEGLRLALIDRGRGTHIAPRLRAGRRSQWASARQLEELQLESLNRLLVFTAEHVPHYREILDGGGVLPLHQLDELDRLPILTKEPIRRRPTDFRPDRAGERYRERKTGGSTGDPFRYRSGLSALSGQWAAIFRAWGWSGYRLGQPMVTLGGGSISPSGGLSRSERLYHVLRRNEPIDCSELDDRRLAAIVERLRRIRPRLVYGYPSVLYEVARRLQAEGAPLAGVQSVITTSEMLFPRQRARLAEAFGAPVFDFYGCNEPDLITGECEQHDGYHIAMESCLVEIVDEEGRLVPDGTVGRILATGLDNRAQVFVRYDTGDLGALDRSPCACGRGLIRLRDIQGRSRDLVRKPDGTAVHGVAINRLVLARTWIDRYQLVQEADGSLVLNLACGSEPRTTEVEKIRDELAARTDRPVEVRLNRPFRTTSGQKTRVVLSLLEENDG